MIIISIFYVLREGAKNIRKRIFDSLDEAYEAFGENGLIPITAMQQIIFYISRYAIQPVWICPSTTYDGKMAYYFITAETKKPYEEWMKYKSEKQNHTDKKE